MPRAMSCSGVVACARRLKSRRGPGGGRSLLRRILALCAWSRSDAASRFFSAPGGELFAPNSPALLGVGPLQRAGGRAMGQFPKSLSGGTAPPPHPPLIISCAIFRFTARVLLCVLLWVFLCVLLCVLKFSSRLILNRAENNKGEGGQSGCFNFF